MLEGGSAGLPVGRQSQRPKELSPWLRNPHDQPRLLAMSGDLKPANLDAGRFALLQEQVPAVATPSYSALAVVQINDRFGLPTAQG